MNRGIQVANLQFRAAILAPLTAVTDLPTHQTLSRPYTSKTLTELTKQCCGIMHKENAALWKIKHLQTKLNGDHTWVPCEMMIGPNDLEFFKDDYPDGPQGLLKPDGAIPILMHTQDDDKPNGHSATNGNSQTPNLKELPRDSSHADKADVPMTDADAPPNPIRTTQRLTSNEERDVNQPLQRSSKDQERAELTSREVAAHPQRTGRLISQGGTRAPDSHTADGRTTTSLTVPGGSDRDNMQLASLNSDMAGKTTNDLGRPVSVLSDSANDLPIHPMFLAPRSARPDRDFGMPEGEAEDMRRLLQLIVQKQEEVCRGVKRLYEGLLRANRMRKTVLTWSKYEAHVGPNRDMSDGEDWYDKEEWGLEEDLKKGQDEEEDEPQTTKKTRTRR